MSREKYPGLIIDFREGLDRGDCHAPTLWQNLPWPRWSVDERVMHNAIYKTLEARDSWQGKRFVGRPSDTSRSRVFDNQQGAPL